MPDEFNARELLLMEAVAQMRRTVELLEQLVNADTPPPRARHVEDRER